jgi:hypothetical protein
MTDVAATIPTALVVDVEPDDVAPTQRATGPWLGFEAWVERVKPLRERLERATGRAVHFSWFLRMDPQVKEIYGDAAWAADAYGRQIEALRSAGDELALHPHAWRWQVDPGRWLHDLGDPGWVEACAATSFEAYERAFGEPCRSHRYGSRFISAALVGQIRQLGVHLDMTVEPGARPLPSLDARSASTGSLPDARRAPRHPYRPAATDPMREDDGDGRPPNAGLWMLPLSAFDPAPLLPRWRQVARRMRFFGQPLHRPAELWAPTDPRGFWRLLERSLDDLQRPYLCLAVRSDALIRPHLAAAVNSKLEALPATALVKRLTFATATEAVDQLTAS